MLSAFCETHRRQIFRDLAEIHASAVVRVDVLVRSCSVPASYWGRPAPLPVARFGKRHLVPLKLRAVERILKSRVAAYGTSSPGFANQHPAVATASSVVLAAWPRSYPRYSSFRCCIGSSFRRNFYGRRFHHDPHKRHWSCSQWFRSLHGRRFLPVRKRFDTHIGCLPR